MMRKMPAHCGDDTCSSCVVAGDYIFLAHHGGGQEADDIVHQTRATLESMAHTLETAGATLDDRGRGRSVKIMKKFNLIICALRQMIAE